MQAGQKVCQAGAYHQCHGRGRRAGHPQACGLRPDAPRPQAHCSPKGCRGSGEGRQAAGRGYGAVPRSSSSLFFAGALRDFHVDGGVEPVGAPVGVLVGDGVRGEVEGGGDVLQDCGLNLVRRKLEANTVFSAARPRDRIGVLSGLGIE